MIERVKIDLRESEFENLSVMTEMVSSQIKRFLPSKTGFLEWKFVCGALHRKFFANGFSTRETRFEIYEIEAMLYMIGYLNQQKNNEMLYLKLQSSIHSFVVEPTGQYKVLVDWYNDNLKRIFYNTDFEELNEIVQDYVNEKYLQHSKNDS